MTEPRIVADIPSTYLIPSNPPFNDSGVSQTQSPSPVQSPLLSPVWPYTIPHFNHSPFMGIVPQQRLVYNIMHGSIYGKQRVFIIITILGV